MRRLPSRMGARFVDLLVGIGHGFILFGGSCAGEDVSEATWSGDVVYDRGYARRGIREMERYVSQRHD